MDVSPNCSLLSAVLKTCISSVLVEMAVLVECNALFASYMDAGVSRESGMLSLCVNQKHRMAYLQLSIELLHFSQQALIHCSESPPLRYAGNSAQGHVILSCT